MARRRLLRAIVLFALLEASRRASPDFSLFPASTTTPRRRAARTAGAALLIVGLANRWVPDAEEAFLANVVRPLSTAGGSGIDVHFCTDVPLKRAALKRFAAWPARVMHWAVGESEPLRRASDCELEIDTALREGRIPGRAASKAYAWWVVTRPDLVILAPLPPWSSLDPTLVHARFRMAAHLGRGANLTTTDNFAWLQEDDRCVDGCAAPCLHAFPRRAAIYDDALVLFSVQRKEAFFGAFSASLRQDPMAACFAAYAPVPYWSWAMSMSETRFTCAVETQGARFGVLTARAELSGLSGSHVAHIMRQWKQRAPSAPIAKNIGDAAARSTHSVIESLH